MLAINQKNRRLPGFRFEAFAPAREDVLPRMDVALFVGFAVSGPIGIPVAVESADQFKTIFGGDLPLVWNKEKGETVYAYLAPTVRSFFRNGGKRCWILRVARVEANIEKPLNRACYNFFPLPGFAAVNFDEKEIKNASPAFARARAKGSWSDDLKIGTAVLSKSFKVSNFTDSDDEKIVALEIGLNEAISTGDLLRLTFSDKNLTLLLIIDELKSEEIQSPPGKRSVLCSSKHFIWLKNLPDLILNAKSHEVSVKMWAKQNNLTLKDASQLFLSERQAKLSAELPENTKVEDTLPEIELAEPLRVSLQFTDSADVETLAAGSLLVTEIEKTEITSPETDKEIIFLQVETISFGNSDLPNGAELICRALGCQRKINKPVSALRAERLTFEFWLKKGRENPAKLGDLGFNDPHERFWGNLPTDEDLYGFSDEIDKKIPAWTQNGETVNFPLAGINDRETLNFPLFAAAFPENYLGAIPLLGTKLQRDGLEEFDEDLFLDPKLKNTGLANLLNEAEFIRYLSPRTRPLWGIHSALVPETVSKIAVESSPVNPSFANYSLEECTIIAVPDALHRGWSKTEEKGGILSPPVFPPPLRPEWRHFQDCGMRFVAAPENLNLKEKNVSSGKFTIEWKSTEKVSDLEFVLEESTSPNFEFAEQIFRGKAKHFDVSKRGAGIYFYRVRAESGKNFSDWSDGLAVKVPPTENWAENPSKDYKPDVLLAVQRALIRMCAARGDLFAVLNLPEHFDETEAYSFVGTLKTTKGLTPAAADVEPFSADETKALSFGAMYHPWLLTHEDAFEGFRNIPPDGAICGVMAMRSDESGAWIAPANEKLKGVLGLAKEIRRESFLDFQDSLINLVRQEPRGFLVLNSDTLSDDADLRSINVRRLLSLLRRLALKHGAEYVFEPNTERFRRQVQRGFTALLDLMFARGAFGGTTPGNSYQVVASNTVNNFQSVEQGQFIVELRVAPSLPLKFVTVRLVNSGGRSNVVEVF